MRDTLWRVSFTRRGDKEAAIELAHQIVHAAEKAGVDIEHVHVEEIEQDGPYAPHDR